MFTVLSWLLVLPDQFSEHNTEVNASGPISEMGGRKLARILDK